MEKFFKSFYAVFHDDKFSAGNLMSLFSLALLNCFSIISEATGTTKVPSPVLELNDRPEVRNIESADKFQQIYSQHYSVGFFLLVANNDSEKLVIRITGLVLGKMTFLNFYTQVWQDFAATARELFTKAYFFSVKPAYLPSNISIDSKPVVLCFKDLTYITFEPDNEEKQDLIQWANDQRWPLFTQITYGLLYDMGLCCDKLLVIAVLDIVKKQQRNTDVAKFSKIVENTARKYRKTLGRNYLFGWTDGNEMADSIVLGSMKIPSLLVFNASSYHFFLPEDPPTEMTEESLRLFLETIAKGAKTPLGGRGFVQRVKRIVFEIYSALYNMFATQPLLSCCLFGLPLGILSIICYTLCSADASVDQEEIYPDSDESDGDDHEKNE